MKKVLLFLLLSTPSFAQMVIVQGNANQVVNYKGGYWIDSVLRVPVRGTAALYASVPTIGRIQVVSNDSMLYYHNGTSWRSIMDYNNLKNKPNLNNYYLASNPSGYITVSGVTWSNLTGIPTTVSGYGITDVYTKTQSDARYLQSFTEVDPTVPSHVKAITTTNISSWNAKQNAITTGSSAQYLRGDLTLATFPTVVSAFTNDAGYITGITSGQITTALGFTPVTNARTITINGTTQDLTANRTWSVGTVTSVGVSSSDFSISGGNPITSSGTVTLNLNNSGVTAGTYGSVTVNAKGIVTAGSNPSINSSVTRPINSTTYTISSTQSARVYYTIRILCTATIGSASAGKVTLQYSTNGGSSWVDVGEVENSNTVSLAVVLNSQTAQTGIIAAEIPSGALCRMNSTSSGTTTITYIRGQEVVY